MSLDPELRLPGGEAAVRVPAVLRTWHSFLLRKLGQRLTAISHEMVERPHGLTARHVALLAAIAEEPGLAQQELGARMHIDRTTMVALIDHLQARGLVERRPGADRRLHALHLTREGAERLPDLLGAVERLHDRLLAPLSDEERGQLLDLLGRLVEDL